MRVKIHASFHFYLVHVAFAKKRKKIASAIARLILAGHIIALFFTYLFSILKIYVDFHIIIRFLNFILNNPQYTRAYAYTLTHVRTNC